MAKAVYTIAFDEKLDMVVMEWNDYATSREFREGTEFMLDLLIKHNCSRVLADIRDMTIIGLEDRTWMENDFLPRAIRQGFKYIAITTPTSYFNKVAVEDISYKIDKKKLTLHFCETLEQGKQWLQVLPK